MGMESGANMNVDQLTVTSLHLEVFFGNQYLSSATGFVIRKDEENFLVTNWHVVSGRNPKTKKLLSDTGAIPNKVRVWHNAKKESVGMWVSKEYPLYDKEGTALWKEKDIGSEKVDVVIFPLENTDGIHLYPLDLGLKDVDLVITPSEDLSIVGFPYGKSSDGKFAMWKSGNLASDFDINYEGKPIFLIDSTTKSGMSGSPVFARRIGQVMSSRGLNIGSSATKFLGVYSGRIVGDGVEDIPDIGMVWKTSVLEELLAVS
jgi:hypothetical protein